MVIAVLLGALLPAPGSAQVNRAAAPRVEVARTEFDLVRGPRGDWWVAEVAVRVTAAPGETSRFVDRVQVTLDLGHEVLRSGQRVLELYRATATAVTVENGTSAFRFYLPPEIVSRDRLRADARYHVVELAVGKRPLPLERVNVSATLATPAAVEAFRARVAADSAANAGILRPQPLTPFSADAGGPAAPTMLYSP